MLNQKLPRITSNARSVIELLAASDPLSIHEIAERSGIPRSSLYRLMNSLSMMKLTELLPDGRIGLTSRWLHLADASRDAMTEWRSAADILKTLERQTKQTIFLNVLERDAVTCIDWMPGRGIDILILRPGRSLPLYADAAGRVALAYVQDQDAERYLQTTTFKPLTEYTLTNADDLRKDILTTRRDGFTRSNEDVTIGIGAIGVPILGSDDMLAGSLSIAGLVDEIFAQQVELVELLREAAERLSEDMSHP